jgi:hypothetical protein
MAEEPESVVDAFKGEAARRHALFMVERVYLPLFGFLGQRNDGMIQMLNNIRAAVKATRSPSPIQPNATGAVALAGPGNCRARSAISF